MDKEQLVTLGFSNLPMVEKLWEIYQKHPTDVHPSWQRLFEQLREERADVVPVVYQKDLLSQAVRIEQLITAYRTYGHLMVAVNPIAVHSLEKPRQLQLKTLGFSESELGEPFPTLGLMESEQASLQEIITLLEQIYCAQIGFEYMGLQAPEMEEWLQKKIESSRGEIHLSLDKKRMILEQLNHSELFEAFLHRKYVGQKRFSLEGGEVLIPTLAELLEKGSGLGIEEWVIGMAHRGRLNVLSNILNKSYEEIFSEFEPGWIPDSFEGSGDVKYHKGFLSTVETAGGQRVKVILSPNPSHLESVDPVVQGQVRAKQDQRKDLSQKQVVPVLIHGDAAISGQGVIYETLQFCHLSGYSTGGTVHLVINNQIGFTTHPYDGRSTHYCTDIARTFSSPTFHVNGEDPEACVFVAELAVELRQRFHTDVFIDLNCYRKYGHNETDEPAFTQPLQYQVIRKKQPVRELYRDDLIQQGVVEREMALALEEEFKRDLQEALEGSQAPEKKKRPKPVKEERSAPKSIKAKTAVAKKELLEVAQRLLEVPEGFSLHKKLGQLNQTRLEMALGNKPVDWGMAETLAYGTLVKEGVAVRLSGQDCQRGTFSHRQSVWFDQKVERSYCPLQHVNEEQGLFEVYNSSLSEYAVLGFEFGYSIASPQALVIWEAQFGDFSNGAQVVIDQYIATAEQKWGQQFGLTLFLPHGYEGQGPEHSSGRMERFLTLAGEENMFIVNPSTPAQLFHLLRRQAYMNAHKPLIVFTPKALLRHPECISSIAEFSRGTFIEIMDDPKAPKQPEVLIFCHGHAYYDLLGECEKKAACIRIEQIYPFNNKHFAEILEKYKGFKRCYFVQEEPKNMGAWPFLREKIEEELPKGVELCYIGREASAATAAGSFALHQKQREAILEALRQL